MNSWGNDKLEGRMDELLTSSVSRGSEPAGFHVRLTPVKPSFPWLTIAYILAAACIAGFFTVQWLAGQNLASMDFGSLFRIDTLTGMFDGISSGKAVSIVAVIIGLFGTVISFLPDKPRVLHRML